MRACGDHRVTLLAGGVGGARMARALRSVLDPGQLTVVVNVGDDMERYSVRVSADPDTVLYTLAGVHGPLGWGRQDDTFHVMEELASLGVKTDFSLGDRDLALCLYRTTMLGAGVPLSEVISHLADALGVSDVAIVPATDDRLETFVQIADGSWLAFQEYFVDRGHKDNVLALAFHGAPTAEAAPGVIESIDAADTLVIAPSNPPLSIWPILAVDSIHSAVKRHPRRVAISPLFSGQPLKGPAASVMHDVGLSQGTLGVLEAYEGLIDYLFVDTGDQGDTRFGEGFGVDVVSQDTRLGGDDQGAGFAEKMLTRVSP